MAVFADQVPVQHNTSLVAGVHSAQHIEHSGFAGAGRAYNDAELSLLHEKTDVVCRRYLIFSHDIIFTDIFKFDEMRQDTFLLFRFYM